MAGYDNDGRLRLTIVDGSTYTGLYAPDGSLNAVLVTGTPSSPLGVMHPCGALYVIEAPTGQYTGAYHSSGALYVNTSASRRNGALNVNTKNTVPPISLSTLTLTNDTIAESAATNDVVGTLVGVTGGSTLSLSDSAGNRFAISGNNIVRGSVPLDYETATSHSITVVETLATAVNNPVSTIFTINVTNVLDAPTLQALTLSSATIVENSAAGTVVGSIQGKRASSTISLTNDAGGRFAISGTQIVAGATATNFETATAHNITIQETLADSPNSPRSTTLTITVTNVFESATLGTLTLSSNSVSENTGPGVAVGDIVGKTTGSTLTLTSNAGGRFVLSGTQIQTGTTPTDFETATSHTITVRETLADSSNSPKDTTFTINVTDVVETVPETFSSITSLKRGVQNYGLVGTKQPWSAQLSNLGRVRFELRPGEGDTWDQTADQQRAQLDGGAGPIWAGNDTRTIYSRFDWMLEGVVYPSEWMLIWEWHHTASSGSPPLAYILEDWRGFPNRLYAVRRDAGPTGDLGNITQFNTVLIDQVEPGRKYSFREEVCFHPTNGFWRVWVDGVQKVNWSGRTGYVNYNNYPEFGIYTNKYSTVNGNKTHVAWFDTQPAPSYNTDGGTTPPPVIKPTAAEYLNSLDNPMSDQEQTNIQNFFNTLDSSGLLDTVAAGSYAGIYNTTTLDGALANLMYPNSLRAVRTGTVNHTPKQGMTPAGGVIDTNCPITLDDNVYFLYMATDPADGAAQAGDAQYTNALSIFGNYIMAGMNNDSQVYPGRVTTFPASIALRRIDAANVEIYVNGTLFQTAAMTEQALAGAYNWLVGGAGTPAQTTTGRILGAAKFQTATSAQILALHNAYNTLRTAQAALP